MEKIKILQFPIANSKGGITQYVLQNWRYIDKSKFQFDFATMSKTLDFAEKLEEEGCKVHYISCYAEEDKEIFADELKKILKEGNYDIVHLHTKQWKSFLVEQIAKEVGVRKIIVHAHSTGIDTLDEQKREKEIQLHNHVLEQLTENIATDFWTCSWKAADFVFGSKISKSKIMLMKNAIELSKYAYNPKVREVYRRKLGIADNEYVIGNVGRFVYQKNQEFLIKVFAEICNSKEMSKQNFRLLLIGSGEREQEYKKLVHENGVEKQVIFTGYRTDIPELLQVMDIFCLPSRFEGFPISVVEAQASGLPCVVSDLITDEIVMNRNIFMMPLNLKMWEKRILEISLEQVERENNILEDRDYDINEQIKYVEQEYRR